LFIHLVNVKKQDLSSQMMGLVQKGWWLGELGYFDGQFGLMGTNM